MSAKKARDSLVPIAVDFSQSYQKAIAALNQALPQLPLLSSHNTDWDGIYCAYDNYQNPGETLEVVSPQYSMIIFTETPQPIYAERKLDGKSKQETVRQRDVVIIPAHASHQVQWYHPGGFIMLGFESRVIERNFHETVNLDRVEIAPHFAQADPLIYQLGLKLKAELESGGLGSRLYAEAIANLLSVHLFKY